MPPHLDPVTAPAAALRLLRGVPSTVASAGTGSDAHRAYRARVRRLQERAPHSLRARLARELAALHRSGSARAR